MLAKTGLKWQDIVLALNKQNIEAFKLYTCSIIIIQNVFILQDGMRPAKKKRGRPKGSKNKPKNALLAGICGENYHVSKTNLD